MKKSIYIVGFLIFGGVLNAQVNKEEGAVGFNTETPQATVDIIAYDADGTTPEGILIPRVTAARAENMGENIAEATLLYITDGTAGAGTTSLVEGKGFYYFNTTTKKWTKVGAGKDTNIYKEDGTLTGNRKVNLEDHNLMFMAKGGKVGIATDAPTEKLDVVGNVRANAVILNRIPPAENSALTTE